MTFNTDMTALQIKTLDKSQKEMLIELSDVDYTFMPRITRTETF